MMRASSESALAISTICIWPVVSVETGVCGGTRRPTRASRAAVRRAQLAAANGSEAAEARGASLPEEDVRGDVEVRREHQLLMNERDAQPPRVAHAAERHGRPSTRIAPSSG